MKYLVSKGQSLHYQRAFPLRLQSITGRAFYKRLHLSKTAPHDEIATAVSSLNHQYEQLVIAAETSLNSNESDPEASTAMLAVLQQQQLNEQLTLNDLWQEYLVHKKLTGRARQIAEIDWHRFIRIAGNLLANDDSDTNRRLNAALKAQFQMRTQRVKASTAKRELSQVMAALKLGATRHQLYWRLDPIKASAPISTSRQSLSQHQITQILKALGSDTSCTDVDAMILLALTAGVTPAEISRLNSNDIVLNGSTPHLHLRNSKQQRYRRAAITIAVDFLKHSIEGAINLSQMSKGYISRVNSERLQAMTQQPGLTLRHAIETFKQRTESLELENNAIDQHAISLNKRFQNSF